MTPARKKRLSLIVLMVVGVAIGVGFALKALNENIMFFFSPADIHAGKAPENKDFRVGGVVVDGSVNRPGEGLTVEFDLTDPVSISVYPGFLFELDENLLVGASNTIQTVTEHPELGWRSFTVDLDPANPLNHGEPVHTPGVDLGIYIGYDPAAGRWRVALSCASLMGSRSRPWRAKSASGSSRIR